MSIMVVFYWPQGGAIGATVQYVYMVLWLQVG